MLQQAWWALNVQLVNNLLISVEDEIWHRFVFVNEQEPTSSRRRWWEMSTCAEAWSAYIQIVGGGGGMMKRRGEEEHLWWVVTFRVWTERMEEMMAQTFVSRRQINSDFMKNAGFLLHVWYNATVSRGEASAGALHSPTKDQGMKKREEINTNKAFKKVEGIGTKGCSAQVQTWTTSSNGTLTVTIKRLIS